MKALSEFRRRARLMGSSFEFIVIAEKERGEQFLDLCVEEVQRLEEILTEFKPTSQTSKINAMAGEAAVSVDEEVYQLITRCKNISRLTQGSFDISAAVFRDIYQFKRENFALPSKESIQDCKKKVDYRKISMQSNNRVRLEEKGMRIGFGGVGKGYAADKVKSILVEQGVQSGVINASGDLTAWGKKLDGTPWRVAISDPEDKQRMLAWLPIDDCMVATSGDYEKYFMHNGTRYSHTIDPKSGMPVSGIKSVTVVSPSAELSDALATAVFIMGPDVGMHMIDQIPQAHALLINDQNRIFTSKKLKLNLVSEA